MKIPRDFVEMLAVFADAGVRYMIVGGYAVGLHARPRTTKDIDVWLASDRDNITKACAALRRFGAPPDIVEALRTATADEIVWMGHAPLRVDFLQSIDGVTFGPAWSRHVDITVDGVPTHVIGRKDLIDNKKAAGRPRDRQDIRALEPSKRPTRRRQ
jgi:hypothetical protein